MKKSFLVALALAIWGALRLLFKILKVIVQVLASIIMYLGLYIPLFYAFFGVILLFTTDFTFGGMGTDQILFYIGLGLSCVASAIIAIRNFIIKPFSSVFAAFRRSSKDRYDDEEDDRRRSRRDDEDDRGRREYDDRRDDRRDDPRDRDDDRRYRSRGYSYAEDADYNRREERSFSRGRYSEEEEGERPIVYYSKRRPGVLVKEYSDRFELFQEDAAGRTYIGTEYKED